MSVNQLSPFAVVEKLIGPPEVVDGAIGLSGKASYGWRRASAAREAGDIPTARNMRKLLSYSERHAIPLKPEHLIWGAPAAEIEALLDQMRARAAPGVAAE